MITKVKQFFSLTSVSISCLLLTTLFTTSSYANDFDYYQKQFNTDKGKAFIKGYADFYQPHVDDAIINNIHFTIEGALASTLREVTSKLYNAVIKRTLAEISAASNTSWNSDEINLLRVCIEDKADYASIENRCVPRMLWAAGYEQFASCTAYNLRSTINSCMGLNVSS